MELSNNLKGGLAKASVDFHSSPMIKAAKFLLRPFIVPLYRGLLRCLGSYYTSHEQIIGVDISPHYIRLCQMRQSYGEVTLKNLASCCIEDFHRESDIITNQHIYVENLSALLKNNKITAKNAAISIPTSGSLVKVITLPEMSDEDLDNAASFNSFWQSFVEGYDFNNYSVFYQVIRRYEPNEQSPDISELEQHMEPDQHIDPLQHAETDLEQHIEPQQPPLPEKMMDVMLVAAPNTEVELYSDIVRASGLEPVIIDLRCFTFKHAFDTNPQNLQSENPTAFLEFGVDENYLFVLDNKTSYMYELNITDEDKTTLITDSENNQKIELLLTNYCKEVKTALVKHYNENKGHIIKDIYVSSTSPLHVDDASSSPLVTRFVNFLSENTPECRFSECNFCDHIKVPKKFTKKVNAQGNLSPWAVTLGLAVERLDIFGHLKHNTPIDGINLLPNRKQYKNLLKNQILAKIGFFIAILASLLSISSSYAMLSSEQKNIQKKILTLQGVQNTHQQKTQELSRPNVFVNKFESLDEVRSHIPSNQLELLKANKHIGNSIPEGVWIEHLKYNSPGKIYVVGKSVGDQQILDFVNAVNQNTNVKVTLKTMEAEKITVQPFNKKVTVKRFTLEGSLESQNVINIQMVN